MHTDWVIFQDETYEFHSSFKLELSEKLKVKLDEITGMKNLERQGFQLILGMIPMNTQIENDLAISNIELITPDSFTTKVSIYWTANEQCELLKLPYKDISEMNLDFGWRKDFPVEKARRYAKPQKVVRKNKSKLNFNIEHYHYLFPDVFIEIYFRKNLVPELIQEMIKCISGFKERWNSQSEENELIKYLSKLEKYGSRAIRFSFDFGNNEPDILDELFKTISNEFLDEISKIQLR